MATTLEPPETIMVDTPRVCCDGGGGALGHPRVFYDVGADGAVVCGYCGRRFILKGSPADPDVAAA
ncbi:MAG: zinc-finger domain-containing protein [Maricaulaceae bacterium]